MRRISSSSGSVDSKALSLLSYSQNVSANINSIIRLVEDIKNSKLGKDLQKFNWNNEDANKVLEAKYISAYNGHLVIKQAGFDNRSFSLGVMFDDLSIVYAHMVKPAIPYGEEVTVYKGQLIGYVGKTGISNAYHLHFEVRIDGVPVSNPEDYFSGVR